MASSANTFAGSVCRWSLGILLGLSVSTLALHSTAYAKEKHQTKAEISKKSNLISTNKKKNTAKQVAKNTKPSKVSSHDTKHSKDKTSKTAHQTDKNNKVSNTKLSSQTTHSKTDQHAKADTHDTKHSKDKLTKTAHAVEKDPKTNKKIKLSVHETADKKADKHTKDKTNKLTKVGNKYSKSSKLSAKDSKNKHDKHPTTLAEDKHSKSQRALASSKHKGKKSAEKYAANKRQDYYMMPGGKQAAGEPVEEQPRKARHLQTGSASYYSDDFNGGRTASGERFDQNKLTCAHGSLPFGCRLRVTNLRNNKSVEVRVNDRGGFSKYGRVLDLSKSAAREIGMLGTGTAKVKVDVIE